VTTVLPQSKLAWMPPSPDIANVDPAKVRIHANSKQMTTPLTPATGPAP